MSLSVRLCFCQLGVCLSGLVSGVFALYVSNMVLAGSIRTVHLCDFSMHEFCGVSDTKVPIWHIFCTHMSCAVALYMAW
jgi:hypothetical protein